MDFMEGAQLAALAGLSGGIVLGLAARIGRLCAMGAVEDAVYGGDTGRLRMLAVAASSAILFTALLAAAGLVAPPETRYLTQGWSPAGAVIGGLLFGYGMAQVGTCGFGAIARAGGGDLRSLLMLIVMGVTASAVLVGPFEGVRLALAMPQGPEEGLDAWAGARLGVDPLLPALLLAAGLGLVAIGPGLTRARVGWGLAVGATIAAAWVATTLAGRIGFDPVSPEGFSFVAPLGETVLTAMTGDAAALLDFSVAAVVGVALGAAIGARITGEFRWEACDDARELRRQLAGAALMGVGGVLAGGCTIGQGLSALSVLSPSAPVVVLAIFAGARLGLYVLVERAARAS